jgi:hypothetical protein
MRSVVFLISVIWVANAGAQTMQFTAVPPDQRLIAVMGNAWRIFAAGPIDTGAAKRLEAILTSRGIPRESDIFLHSPGGNMFEGMELGKVIRKWNLRAHVGQRTTERNSQGGICYSACSLAFLGGEFRFVSKDSNFGVHQFTTAAPSPHDLAIAQMASAAVVEYIRSMDVDPGLFNFAAGTLSSDMHILTQAKMLELHVVNNGIKATKCGR